MRRRKSMTPVPSSVSAVAPGHGGIAGVELVPYGGGIGTLDEQVVRDPAVQRLQVASVVVEANPDAPLARALPGFIQPVGPATVVVERRASGDRQACDDDVLMSERLRLIELPLEFVEGVAAHVRRRSA